jgi:uncharacterized membrane protein
MMMMMFINFNMAVGYKIYLQTSQNHKYKIRKIYSCLPKRTSSPNSPNMPFATMAGRGKKVGRPNTLPKALVNSLLVAGLGAHTFTGPVNLLESRANSMMMMFS